MDVRYLYINKLQKIRNNFVTFLLTIQNAHITMALTRRGKTMATIALYTDKINQMAGLVKEVKTAVTDYKTELLTLKTKAISVNGSICDLQDVISSIQASSQTQEEKIESLETFKNNSEEFIADVVRTDSEVANIVKQRKEEFYGAYSYLKPQSEKGWKEKAADWCKEHWKELLTTVIIVIGAALAIVAVICSGGLALVPMLTALLTTLGVSAAMATTIATVASLTIAGIAIVSTLGSSALNIVDTWCDMSENSTFKSWQTAMNWISIISNGLYSIGAIYNSLTAKLANVGKGGTYTDLDDGLNFSNRALEHMGEGGRQVPMQTLQDAIRYGEVMPDPRGSGVSMYYTTMYKNGKMYNLEVLYDEVTNTVYHFEYARKAMGNLPAISK